MMCSTPLGRAPTTETTRRIVSIVFADMKGSTQIGERLDPEAVRSVLTRFYVAAREILERHGGTVEKFIGDAVMAVFGVPRVREDDALRAVRAAGELRDTLERMNAELIDRFGVGLHLRTGVNTGEVVAGDPSTGSSFVSGDAVNVAARLEQAAPPGDVLIGLETHRAVSHAVDAEPVEPLELKGKSERVPAFRLLRVHDVGGRRPMGSPLVGRDEELATLQAEFRRMTEGGSPRVVLVTGPPGIGKSRLFNDFRAEIEDRAKVVVGRCLAEGEGGWARPIADIVTEATDLDMAASEEEACLRVATLLAGRERAPVVALSAARAAGLAAGGTMDEAAWAVRELLTGLAESEPVVLEIDDAQWAAPELVELVVRLAEGQSNMLVLLAAHPEFAHDAAPSLSRVRSRLTAIELGNLEDVEGAKVAEHLLGGRLDPRIAARLLASAGGNPLFLEEIVRMLRDDGRLVDGPDGWTVAGDASEVTMPTSIRSVLAARMDLLTDDERDVLAAAAVGGNDVVIDDVVSVVGEGIGTLRQIANRLLDRQLLTSSGLDEVSSLRFPHGIVREAAYATLTKERRAELHERFADAREQRGG
jgi:class 3 adenylate cyclase